MMHHPQWIYLHHLPDYLNDLNACHDMEKILEEQGLCVDYVNTLRDFGIAPRVMSRYGLVHATASQRAEAFLRAIGKWEEGE